MYKFLENIIEAFGWIKIAIAPTALGVIAGWILYYNMPTTAGSILAIVLIAIGLVIGCIWATRIWNTTGTNAFLATTMATPDIDDAIRKNEVTALEAYKAAYVFLNMQNAREPSNEISSLLGSMSLCMCQDGQKRPMDQAQWEDWEDAMRTSGTRVRLYNKDVEDYGILITTTEGYQVLHAFLKAYNHRGPTSEIEFLITHMLPETGEHYQVFKDDWNDAVAYMRTNKNCADIQWK